MKSLVHLLFACGVLCHIPVEAEQLDPQRILSLNRQRLELVNDTNTVRHKRLAAVFLTSLSQYFRRNVTFTPPSDCLFVRHPGASPTNWRHYFTLECLRSDFQFPMYFELGYFTATPDKTTPEIVEIFEDLKPATRFSGSLRIVESTISHSIIDSGYDMQSGSMVIYCQLLEIRPKDAIEPGSSDTEPTRAEVIRRLEQGLFVPPQLILKYLRQEN